MSYQLLKEDVLFYQRFLKSAGFYNDELDGDWGPNTNKADADFLSTGASIAEQLGKFDARSEGNIITLLPKAQIEARKFLQLCKNAGKDVRIISGTRTYNEQNTIYAQGRTTPGPVVSHARGGQSNHNFGIAWDIGIFNNGSYSTNDEEYISLAETILPNITTLEWGGNWHSIKDNPHYQLKAVSNDVGDIRLLFENGQVYV
ncbi:MAG TPA: M15 family metallopeptidase [Parafilimonas sp.]|nr:M15 family metallopeptidase [Parafilimonas sp.]